VTNSTKVRRGPKYRQLGTKAHQHVSVADQLLAEALRTTPAGAAMRLRRAEEVLRAALSIRATPMLFRLAPITSELMTAVYAEGQVSVREAITEKTEIDAAEDVVRMALALEDTPENRAALVERLRSEKRATLRLLAALRSQ
jgi:hypothetical protein